MTKREYYGITCGPVSGYKFIVVWGTMTDALAADEPAKISKAVRPQFPALTGLRGLAAYSILVAHAINFQTIYSPSLTALAYFSMSLFFTLSGFVIHYNYGSDFAANGIGSASKRFLIARFARLYPLYFVGLIVSVSVDPQLPFFHNALIALSCLTLTQTWFNVPGATGDLIGGSWSISTEFFLYLLFIPFAAAIRRITSPIPWLLGLCAMAIVVLLAVSVLRGPIATYLAFIQFSDNPRVSAPPFFWLTYFSPPIRGFEFFGGALAAQFCMTKAEFRGMDRAASLLLSACVGWCVLVIVVLCRIDNSIVQTFLPNFIFAPAIIVILILVCRHDSYLTRLMSSPTMQMAGDISYSVYLLQNLVFLAVAASFAGRAGVAAIPRTILVILIATALGYGVWHLFEAPARSWIRSLPKRIGRKVERSSAKATALGDALDQ
ncbi:MAG TPA: acyltransferase [Xanthobacteraceae bacterium]|nr:acyltransferase [Xanthobacteraceae bacterium]